MEIACELPTGYQVNGGGMLRFVRTAAIGQRELFFAFMLSHQLPDKSWFRGIPIFSAMDLANSTSSTAGYDPFTRSK